MKIDFHLVWIVHIEKRVLDSVQKDHFLLFRELQRPFFARHAAYAEINREQQGFEPRRHCAVSRVPHDEYRARGGAEYSFHRTTDDHALIPRSTVCPYHHEVGWMFIQILQDRDTGAAFSHLRGHGKITTVLLAEVGESGLH